MGSDNSKQTKQPPVPPAARPTTTKVTSARAQVDEPEKFQYGPPRPQPSGSAPTNRPTPPQVTNQRTSMQAPPPYSTVDPRKVTSVSNSNRPVNFPANIVEPQTYCVICNRLNDHETINCPLQQNFQNNPFPAGAPYQNPPPIPPLPQKRPANDPFKWTSNQYQKEHQVTQPLKVDTKLPNKKPSPKQTPSPNYDSPHNPYVWTNKKATEHEQQPSLGTTTTTHATMKPFLIDLNKELPTLSEKIKENSLPSFQHFHAKLKKNTPVSTIRKAMVGDKYLSDVKFIVNGSVYHAHKMIMITASFYFYDHFHLKGESELKVDSIDPETFQKIMDYCYTDKIEVTEDNVLELLLAANELQVRQITNVCHGFISNIMSADSIFTIFEKALELNNAIFKKKCLDYINKNEVKCFTSKGFYAMTLPSLLKILEACQYPSEKVSEIVEKWTNGSLGFTEEPAVNVPEATISPTPGKSQGAVKKGTPGKKNKQPKQTKNAKIPPLMSLPVPRPNFGPPLVSPFPRQPMYTQQQQQQQQIPPFPYMYNSNRPFAGPPTSAPNGNPYNVLPSRNEKDDDDNESIISKDDEEKIKIQVCGPRQQLETQFSRIDLVCKRSMLIHEIWFSENLAPKCKEVKVTIVVLEGKRQNEIHHRTIPNNKPGMRMNFLRFTRDPLKVYIGQKFYVKMNFNDAAQRLNVTAEGLSSDEMIGLRKDPDVKKYFNCIASLVVSEMPTS